MDVEIVKPEFVPVENGIRDQSKGNEPVPWHTEPITFGSHGSEEAVNGPEDHLPKHAVDDWLESKPMQIHTLYFVKYRSYDDPKLKAKFDAAEKDVQDKSRARSQLIEKLRAIRSKKNQLSEQIGQLSKENTRFKELLDEKKKEMEPVNDALKELRPNNSNRERGAPICSSEEDLNKTIKHLEYRIQHESIPLTEEKQILREIKQLEGTRVQIIAIIARKADVEERLGSKAHLQDQYNQMGDGFSGVKKERQVVTTKLKQLLDEKSALNEDIKKLEEVLDAATEKCNNAQEVVKELWKKSNEGNACFYENRVLLSKAKNLAVKKNLAALKEFSNSEFEKFLMMWNESKSFREDYEKRILQSLDNRQLSRDGRMRGPDEKPLVIPETSTSSKPEQVTALKPKQTKNDSVPILQNGTEKIQNEPKSKPIKDVKSKVVERVDEEKIIAIEKPDKVEIKVDEAKLKKIRREEEIAKAKQALERKKKLAEKAVAKAAIKAQKEAEKKEKDREKKLKKKASASGLLPEPVEQPTEAEAEVAEPEKTEEFTEEHIISKPKSRKEGAIRNRTRTKGPDVISKVILKRKKSTNYWVWAAPAAVSIMMVFVIGYKYLI